MSCPLINPLPPPLLSLYIAHLSWVRAIGLGCRPFKVHLYYASMIERERGREIKRRGGKEERERERMDSESIHCSVNGDWERTNSIVCARSNCSLIQRIDISYNVNANVWIRYFNYIKMKNDSNVYWSTAFFKFLLEICQIISTFSLSCGDLFQYLFYYRDGKYSWFLHIITYMIHCYISS